MSSDTPDGGRITPLGDLWPGKSGQAEGPSVFALIDQRLDRIEKRLDALEASRNRGEMKAIFEVRVDESAFWKKGVGILAAAGEAERQISADLEAAFASIQDMEAKVSLLAEVSADGDTSGIRDAVAALEGRISTIEARIAASADASASPGVRLSLLEAKVQSLLSARGPGSVRDAGRECRRG
ncbi:hypothetical protein [Enterovirga rhinocerotis]|uniref:Uncharacterized protein n=1 Tax=Enterovirga rhinocerotis TaxID=1339210 RepID=A0A4R7C1M4_9HYPH|nr:hypothetical protein [Enterovirga rhinocerotis]TDR90286.1 hypothetical protein EV668_3132 [Enterovirga rhinocerotis]